MTAPAKTMRAVVYDATKALNMNMRWEAAFPVPVPGPKQVLVKTFCAAINPVDYKLPTLPIVGRFVIGKAVAQDFCGEVVASGAGATFSPGDRIFGNGSGCLADFTVADSASCALLPPGLSDAVAAAIPTAGLTGLQALKAARIKPGDNALVVGGSGGCGGAGVQLARILGAAKVTAICSESNKAMVAKLGADAVCCYGKGDADLLAQLAPLGKFDVIYDTVTSPQDPDYGTLLSPLLTDKGTLVAINGGGGDWARLLLGTMFGCSLHRSKYKLIVKKSSGVELAELGRWALEGKLEVPIDMEAEWSEAGVQAAYERLASRRSRGKLVIRIEHAPQPPAPTRA